MTDTRGKTIDGYGTLYKYTTPSPLLQDPAGYVSFSGLSSEMFPIATRSYPPVRMNFFTIAGLSTYKRSHRHLDFSRVQNKRT